MEGYYGVEECCDVMWKSCGGVKGVAVRKNGGVCIYNENHSNTSSWINLFYYLSFSFRRKKERKKEGRKESPLYFALLCFALLLSFFFFFTLRALFYFF